MNYDLSIEKDIKSFNDYASKLLEGESRVELKKIIKTRSVSQNKYFHVVVTLYAIAYGCTITEAKTDLKRDYGLVYEKKGKKYLISSSDLDSKEMTEFIEYIRTKSSKEMGVYIPDANEYLIGKYGIDKEISKYREYI